MIVIKARNVHKAFQVGMFELNIHGVPRESRAGNVIVMREPVTTVYREPSERVLFWASRDANPFFHFMEGLWMLAGRNDAAWISQFSANISQFSDDGVVFHGAYGHRWINHFNKEIPTDPNVEYDGGGWESHFNQLQMIANILKANPDDRRCVLQMWDCERDLGQEGKDFPCNTQIYFRISVDGRLNMTVLNRSNDIIWGAYGANAVHMSMLQEFMAAWLGVPIGAYWQVSNDYHAYYDVFEKHIGVTQESYYNPYALGTVSPFPMVNGPIEDWLSDLEMFMDEGPIPAMKDRFFRKVVSPMYNAWFAWKQTEGSKKQRVQNALEQLSSCIATDWKLACEEWLIRRAS